MSSNICNSLFNQRSIVDDSRTQFRTVRMHNVKVKVYLRLSERLSARNLAVYFGNSGQTKHAMEESQWNGVREKDKEWEQKLRLLEISF